MNPAQTSGSQAAATRPHPHRLRSSALGLLIFLLVQFVLGIVVNLYVHVPAGRAGYGAAAPALLLHAVAGLALVLGSISLAVRSVTARARQIMAPAIISALVVVAAAVNGLAFLGNGADGASLAMAVCAAVAMFCYALILYRLPEPGDEQLYT